MREVQIVRGAAGADPVHMLVPVPPQLAPSKLVQDVKGRTERRLQDEFPYLHRKCRGRHLRARGYFCATAGAVTGKTVRECIESRKWDAEVEGFKVTEFAVHYLIHKP